MVSDNGMDPNDELAQDQLGLDHELGITTEGEAGSVPTEPTVQQLAERIEALNQFNQQLLAQNQQLDAQTRGLQSKVDTGLNAIRRDTEAWVQSIDWNLRAQQDQEAMAQWINSLDEDQRPVAEVLLNRMNQIQQQQQPVYQPTPEPIPQEQAPVYLNQADYIQAAWSPYVQFAEQMGVPRNNVDWSLVQATMADANLLPDDNKEQQFRDYIVQLRAQQISTPASNAKGDNPPVQGGGQVNTADLRSADATRDAFLEGRITQDTYLERMRALGEPA